MTDPISATAAICKALVAIVGLLRTIPSKNQSSGHENKLNLKFCEKNLELLVKKAKDVLDKGKDPDSKWLKDLANTVTAGEFYGDIIKHISHHKLEENNIWNNLEKQLEALETKLEEFNKHPENQSSGHENAVEMPPGNVRRRLLYLSRFPKKYVFNRQRISRLLVAHEFIAAERDEPPLQHLTNWLDPAESSWDGDGAPNHFLIGNDVEKLTPTWPENDNLVREAIVESTESTEFEIFSSLIFLGKRNDTLKLNTTQFPLLKVLSLRNITLKNGSDLGKLSLLKYLDLKGTNASDCSWLKGLEELEMLDLRDTDVEKIEKKYLENLMKLQHLLLGYRPNTKDNWLAGANLDTTELTTKLKTLRAIRWPDKINVSLEVADLSVTGLEKSDQKSFWDVVEKFENLIRLGVAMTKGSVIKLEDCPAKLKEKLKRLRMEGRMEGSHSGLEKLSQFVNLIDLTLASHQPIHTDSIPDLSNLLCLRLYSFCKVKTLTLRVKGFKSLKKLVIGDMAKLETVQIDSNVIETVETLKLCNLPELSELNYRASNSQHRLLRRRKSETEPPQSEKETPIQKSIFLRGFEKILFEKWPGLKIYQYDMNKQCYQEVHARNLTT